ncbi:hypothetical protein CPB86DRAFT_814231 [Serendipita vermifera]|nr:hypothetical protein CPB86DRAFT_814231 [Serendipita vermifera]
MKIHTPHARSNARPSHSQHQHQHQHPQQPLPVSQSTSHHPAPIAPEVDRRRTRGRDLEESDGPTTHVTLSSALSPSAVQNPNLASLSALSSVAHEELLELERREAIRRARYEAAHAELEARVVSQTSSASRSAGTSPESTPFFGPISHVNVPTQHSVYCDGESFTNPTTHGAAIVPRLPSCHHEECHKSYRTLLRLAQRTNGGLAGLQDALAPLHLYEERGVHLTSHAHSGSGSTHSRTAHHRHHPYEVPHHPAVSGRKTSPIDTTPSPISTDESSELPPLSSGPTTATSSTTIDNNHEYYTPSTSPFLHAIRSMNVGKSRTSSRGPSRAPSPVPLHLPPAVTALASLNSSSYGEQSSSSTSRSFAIGRNDRHHRSNRSHPSLHSPQDSGPDSHAYHHHHYLYPRSHGNSPPGTPAPLTILSRQKRTTPSINTGNGTTAPTSKHSIDALLSGPTSSTGPTLSSHYVLDTTAAPTPSLSSSASSTTSGRPGLKTDFPSANEPMLPPSNYPPPPSRSQPTSAVASPVRSVAGSFEAPSQVHTAFASIPPLPPLVPGLPLSGSGFNERSSNSSPPTPSSSYSNLAHSVRIAFGMTPIHPPNYFSSSSNSSRSTVGFGNSSVRGTRSSSPPIILPPLKLGSVSGKASPVQGSDDELPPLSSAKDVQLPHLDSLVREGDSMDLDDDTQ